MLWTWSGTDTESVITFTEMVINYLGLKLRKLREKHLETLRGWRNAAAVKSFMHSQQHITREMQREWFRSVSNTRHIYFVVEYRGDMIGTVFLKNIDTKQEECEVGVLAREENFETIAIAIAQICMAEIAFYIYDMKTIYGHVFENNTRAISNYVWLGGVKTESIDAHSIMMKAAITDYERKRKKLLIAAEAMHPESGSMLIVLDNEDGSDDVVRYLVDKLSDKVFSEKKEKIRFSIQRL